ncbi:MAG: AEC family transporter [Candidatus Thiodiazotropha sp. (ex Semelilucina semeliformis)]|nr:AEC family transporter [Candidatus Thiodiazotropha sp. (ex Semelilucina semeliformis)]
MSSIAAALLPILALILLGLILKYTQFIPEMSWSGMERLTYYLLFPALLIHTLSRQNLAGIPWLEILSVVVIVLLLSSLLLIVWYGFFSSIAGTTFTSIFQGGVRFNTYIALALAQAFYGDQGLAMGAVAAGFMIVLINLLCISVLSKWGKPKQGDTVGFIKEILANPLIIACLIGWTLSLTGIGLPGPAEETLEIIGRAALPFGLLAVGAALKPRSIKGHLNPALIASLVQFAFKPLATAILISLTGLSGIAAGVLIIAFMTPTAPSAYILARQLGGDAETMASIITLQTLLAFLVMPTIAYLLLG